MFSALAGSIDCPQSGDDHSTQPEFILSGRAMLSTGEEFLCTAQNVTVRSARIMARVEVEVGQVIVCYLENLGILPGKVIGLAREHFVVGFALKEARRDRVAAQLEWQSHHASRTVALRRAPRIVPLHRAVEVRLGDRMVFDGTILNISMSGAAIGLEGAGIPFAGTRVRVGERFATVVRLIETGIAVQFCVPFTPENFDERVRL